MPKRLQKAAKEAERARQEAEQMEELKRKKGIDMVKYLNQHRMGKGKAIIGTDGLTDAQRRRRALREVLLPSIDSVARKGKGYVPCTAQCYNPCADWCTPFAYTC